MKFYRKNWYYIGGILFIVLAFFMGFWGNGNFSRIQIVLIYSFMAVLIHQLEEYALPGGFPDIFNIAVLGEREAPERYPLNQNQFLIVNVFLAYIFYIVPIFLPNVIWLGMAQVLCGMVQLIIHSVITNIRLKSLYNPGLAAVVFLHCPIGVYYFWYVAANGLAATSDYIWAAVATVIVAFLMVGLPVLVLRNKQSKYPFDESELYRYGKEKLQKMLGKCASNA